MFKDLFSNRLFIGAFAIFIFCVGGSLFYMQHVTQKGEKERAETQARVAQWNERQNSTTAVSQVSETPQGHVHADGTFHTELVSSEQQTDNIGNHDSKDAKQHGIIAPSTQNDAIFHKPHKPPSEEERAEQRYDIAAAEYFKAMQEYHRKDQALDKEWELLRAEGDELEKEAEVAIKTGNREELLRLRDAMLDDIEKRQELWKKTEDLRAEKPIRPTPPPSMERSSNQ